MKELKASILECLQSFKGSGKFAAVHTTAFVFPGLQLEGLGEIAFPFQEIQARALIQLARKAPFGQGSETILDANVRSGWEIDADKLSFTNPGWTKFLEKAVNKVKKELGIENYVVEAHFYKLLVYEKGDFFLPHKDTEKESGMFGSLVVNLPSNYEGGELIIRFEGEELVGDFADNAANYHIDFAAFYADCDHEVKPLKSGYRICLVYNLIQKTAGSKIELQSIQNHVDKLANVFSQHPDLQPYIVLLGHQYTPANFSYEGLKLNDRYKAEALLRAAKKLGFYAKLCLVTSFKEGLPADSGYYGYGDDGGDEDAEMEEVYDEWMAIEHWCKSEIPNLINVDFKEEDLIASFVLDEDEPIVKESTGYMGNYGPDLMHWYHYGAVMIWSPEYNSELLKEQNTITQLEWIEYFNHSRPASDTELKAVNSILQSGMSTDRISAKNANFNAIAEWVVHQNDADFLLNLENERLQLFFEKITTESWQKIWEWLPENISLKILEKLTDSFKPVVIEKLPEHIRSMESRNKTTAVVKNLVAGLPIYFEKLSQQGNYPLKAAAISDLIWIENRFSLSSSWSIPLGRAISKIADWGYIHKVMVPQLLMEKTESGLHQHLLDFCTSYLLDRAHNKPQPPADWSRPLPDTKKNEQIWEMLKPFMESPDEQVLDYKKRMAEREAVEDAIRKEKVDLTTTTIRKGSPHTLRITKNQASYQHQLQIWKQDVNLLKQLMTL